MNPGVTAAPASRVNHPSSLRLQRTHTVAGEAGPSAGPRPNMARRIDNVYIHLNAIDSARR
eukprot:6983592-Heterocapsa_arctica.AAC.1